MFALGFWCGKAEGYDEDSWSVEDVTGDFDEALDNLFDARNFAAAGNSHWDGSRLMVKVLRDGQAAWEPLAEESWVE